MSKLAESGVRAIKWNTVTTILRFGLQLAAQVVLARILGPDNYGVFGLGMVVLTFSTFLSNFGLGQSLLHRPEVTDEDIRFAFTWQVVAGLAAMALVWLAAPSIAAFFHEPRAESVIRWLSLTCLFSAASSPAGNLVQRSLNFKALGLAQVASYAVGYLGVGIPMALMGQGYAALVAAWLTQVGLVAVASFALHPHSVRPLFRYPHMGSAMNVSGLVFITNVVNWVLNNLDRIVIGRLLNAHAVGVYTAGYNLATMPNSLLLGSLQPTLMAIGARMQGETDRLRSAYEQILAITWVVLLPVFIALAAGAPEIVAMLYGPKWAEVPQVLSWLFLAMPALISWGLSTPILWSSGRRAWESLLQLPVIALALAAYWALNHYGQPDVQSAAAVTVAVILLRMLLVSGAAAKAVGLPWRAWPPLLLRGLMLGLLGVAALAAARALPFALPPLAVLALGWGAAAVVAVGLVLRWPATFLGAPTVRILLRFVPRLGRWLGRAA